MSDLSLGPKEILEPLGCLQDGRGSDDGCRGNNRLDPLRENGGQDVRG